MSMKLWVMRHGYSGAFQRDPKKERERPLRSEGIEAVKATVKAMVQTDTVLPKVIFCSPLERTKNTADLVGYLLGIQVNAVDDLAPNRPLEDRILELMAHGEVKRIMLVGHVDNTSPAFNNLGDGWDDLVMAECRRLKIDRKTGDWKIKWSVKPSDLGLKDYGG